ncbi:alcohol dehydrogenase catalytic domain-containing protein [Alicyclobacillus tolerans]|uniref:alcohol dehydrogenase catalytic domain-containing protein n=1 Tax=Alicyclobacillus tolerans TaxID=90970 RepID=UPI001F3D0CB7|nr:alcohol dehydrogenase catalytic domain-containing protein [Alicyclobacillus tolerans]MCF8568001.1 alcohol dehydrogenase catalytic domain-containing protein [Alicyclobacillus tolerans]
MKAAVFEEIGVVTVKEVPKPVAEPGGVLLKVEAGTICGTDIRIFRNGHKKVSFPWILGHEFVGTVVQTDDEAQAPLGNRVAVMPGVSCGNCEACASGRIHLCSATRSIGYHVPGAFAEYVAIPSDFVKYKHLVPVPDNVKSSYAAVMEPLAVVLNAHERAYTHLNDVVVILGAGPIGAMHCEIARLRGAKTIIVADILDSRLAQMQKHFPSLVYVNSKDENLLEVVQSLTSRLGADVVITANSSPQAQVQSLELLAPRGRVVFFGGLPPAKSIVALDTNIIHYNELEVYGLYGSSMKHNYQSMQMLQNGSINIEAIVTHELPLADIRSGIELVEQGDAMRVAILPHN